MAPHGREWGIRTLAKGQYCFAAESKSRIVPCPHLCYTQVLDCCPAILSEYRLHVMTEEQDLLTRVRYNRLIDDFTGLACHSLQSHFRTELPGLGQVETDEVYIGLDRHLSHFVVPIQVRRGGEQFSAGQMEQDIGMAETQFPELKCRPIAAQFKRGGAIALFELELTKDGLRIRNEKHYRLISADHVFSLGSKNQGQRRAVLASNRG